MKRLFFEIWENLYYLFAFRSEYFLLKRKAKPNRSNDTLKLIFWGIIIVILIILGYQFPFIGLSDFTAPTGEYFRGKTFWDWIELAILPIILTLVAYRFTNEQKARELAIAQSNKGADTLQKYFDQLANLFIEQDLSSDEKKSAAAEFTKARTLITLDMLDGRQKGHLIRFLYELELINKEETTIELRRANLSMLVLEPGYYEGINLSKTNLDQAEIFHCNFSKGDFSGCTIENSILESVNFYEADLNYVSFYKSDLFDSSLSKSQLTKAKFKDANLYRAKLEDIQARSSNFRGANLRKALLNGAYLAFADFSFANLREADLSGADLNHVNFTGASLYNSILDYTDLTEAIISKRQLRQAKSHKGAKLPK